MATPLPSPLFAAHSDLGLRRCVHLDLLRPRPCCCVHTLVVCARAPRAVCAPPQEGEKFQVVDTAWRELMEGASVAPGALVVGADKEKLVALQVGRGWGLCVCGGRCCEGGKGGEGGGNRGWWWDL